MHFHILEKKAKKNCALVVLKAVMEAAHHLKDALVALWIVMCEKPYDGSLTHARTHTHTNERTSQPYDGSKRRGEEGGGVRGRRKHARTHVHARTRVHILAPVPRVQAGRRGGAPPGAEKRAP